MAADVPYYAPPVAEKHPPQLLLGKCDVHETHSGHIHTSPISIPGRAFNAGINNTSCTESGSDHQNGK